MSTRVYGASDDLIEFEGDIRGEVGCYGNSSREKGVLLSFSDGTVLEVKYSGRVSGVWAISLLVEGVRFKRIDQCADPDGDPYSDVAHFHDGLKSCFAATGDWERVS
jgi:hypothetical protein